jgi:glycosyltransferase involved in cell wall biosynthesis
MGHLRTQPMVTVGRRRFSERPLLCVSSLDPAGGVDTLLTAFGLLAGDRHRLRLDIVGEGPLGESLRAHAGDLGLDRVQFRGSLPWHRVRAAMNRCAALVLPHHDDEAARTGGLHGPLRDALELGRPLVATDRVALPEMLQRVPNARVVPPGNPTALALALTDVLGPVTRSDRWAGAWCGAAG